MTNDGTYVYSFDAENRAYSAAGVTYYYDGNGERVAKSTGPLYWNGTGSDALAESDTTGALTREYVFFNGKRVARIDIAVPPAAEVVHYFFADHLGTNDVLTDAAGNIQNDCDYYPYGGELPCAQQTVSDQKFKFTGKERDPETGLDYFFARYYSNQFGRFLTPDWSATPTPVPYAKLSLPQSLNLYAYVQNNPITGIDPDGHCCDQARQTANDIKKEIRSDVWQVGHALKTAVRAYARAWTEVGKVFSENPNFSFSNITEDDIDNISKNLVIIVATEGEGALAEAGQVSEESELASTTEETTGTEKSYQTYTKENPATGEVYSGRTSGTGSAEENVAKRDAYHQMNKRGFGPAALDKSSPNPGAIRGREQILIEQNGGAKSMGGSSANAINGVSPRNPQAAEFRAAAVREFGKN